jgi:hypothetical protein
MALLHSMCVLHGCRCCPAVTFVALGNGAPDLSANIAAISAGEVVLSAGAFTGAAMFVQVGLDHTYFFADMCCVIKGVLGCFGCLCLFVVLHLPLCQVCVSSVACVSATELMQSLLDKA